MRFMIFAAGLCLAAPAITQERLPIPDVPFIQETHEAFPLSGSAENDLSSITVGPQGEIWVASQAGVHRLKAGTWSTPEGGRIGPCHSLWFDRDGVLWIGAWNGVYALRSGKIVRDGLADLPVGCVRGGREGIFAAGPFGIFRHTPRGWEAVKGEWHRNIRAVQPMPDGTLWIATASGLYVKDLKSAGPKCRRIGIPREILSSNVNALTLQPDGSLLVGSTGGIDVYRNGKRIYFYSSPQRIPYRHVRGISVDRSGRIWAATPIGVIRRNSADWSLRHSRRWLLSDDVRDVTVDSEGTAWAATSAGVSAIRPQRMTLQQKAEIYLQKLRDRHIRPPGLVGPAVLAVPGDLSKSFIEDDDNDGEHTSHYLAMESYRYAVTRDPQARENAKAAAHALMFLQDITGTSHFIARSVLPIDTPPRHEVDRTFTPQEISESNRTEPREKIIPQRWIVSKDGRWRWKRDTSSDEVDGHIFGYAAYWEMCADESEKRRVADYVDRIVGGIVDNGFVLKDIDGRATRWGNWSPESLNHDPTWVEEAAGNSVEMLSYLGVAYRMTGKQRYVEAAKLLIDKHGYAKNALRTVYQTPSERTHIEDELLSIVYPNALRYAVLPELKPIFQKSMQAWFPACRQDNIALYDFVYARYSGKSVPLKPAVDQLRDWPLDLIEWTVDNTRREDAPLDLTPGVDPGKLRRMLPRSEMGICMFDQEPYRAVIGRNGEREDKPTYWLLAYWMGRYYGFIGAP